MTTQEIKELIGQFGKIEFNGKYYPSIVHATLTEIIGSEVLITRPDRSQMLIKIDSIKKFTRKAEK